MKHFLRVFFALAVSSLAASAEVIDKFAPILVDVTRPEFFILVGEIDSRTALNFDRAIDEYGVPEVLILNSEGGLVDQGLNVARSIHKNGVDTFIPESGGCYSACALIFLAGKVRVADGELGVHQIRNSSDSLMSGQVAISDILDVLSDFDVPNALLVDMFRTPPESMHVLSAEEKLAYGFVLRPAAERSSGVTPSLEQSALDLIIRYNLSWSKPNDTALAELGRYYSQNIEFYGKPYSVAEVLKEKRSFAERWPIRRYIVDGESVSISCEGDLCFASGNVAWDAASPERAKSSHGTALFQLTILFEHGIPHIISEGGRVLERTP